MTRAVLLPTGADPFHIAYWLRHYRTWSDGIDELHVGVCGRIPPAIRGYIGEQIEAVGGTVHWFGRRTSHGTVLRYLYDQTRCDTIMIAEDDGFVRSPQAVQEAFALVEGGWVDVVGCARNGYASASILRIAEDRFGVETRGLGLWPCFFFAHRDQIAATDEWFEGRNWRAGDSFLGVDLEEGASADTFLWLTYQLRELGLRIDLRDAHRMEGPPVEHSAPWFHVGSLSQGHGWLWQNPSMTEAARAVEVEQCRRLPVGEMVKRFSWWDRFWRAWDGRMGGYHAAYRYGMESMMEEFGIRASEVETVRQMDDWLIKWDETD